MHRSFYLPKVICFSSSICFWDRNSAKCCSAHAVNQPCHYLLHSARILNGFARRKCLGSWITRYVRSFLRRGRLFMDAQELSSQPVWAIFLMVQCRQGGRQDINQPAIKLHLLCATSEPYKMRQHLENASDGAALEKAEVEAWEREC